MALTLALPRAPRLAIVSPAPAEDDGEVRALFTSPRNLAHLLFKPRHLTLEDVAAQRTQRAADPAILDFRIHSLATPRVFLGVCGLFQIDRANSAAQVGIMVADTRHRTGVASEALLLLLTHAFEALGLHRLTFETAIDNEPMRRWFEAVHVTQETVFQEAWSDGRDGRIDVVGYRILRREWPVVKQALETRVAKAREDTT
ncbi:hypothetical protein BOTBODRAFT_57799 [Botryobasidium botryosum FD-172 SS1]|uniref:N-acetyltransferase domain-containing protein n=1 Tax=Botryobasidium botryosum (strain FD-172 SS1) TaxID=930990 RepID=A0A067M5U6_BOTB1|nr:hypothetical protein BOTBODRAFT_57799 [Botryobasidium botryosum FD-172 SS1]